MILLAQFLREAGKSPSALLGSFVALSIAAWSSWTARSVEPIPFSRMIPAVLALTVVTALTTSFGPTTIGVSLAGFDFGNATSLQDGTYSVLGEDDGSTWLLSCEPGANAVRIRTDAIDLYQTVGYGPTPPPASWDHFPGVGFVQRCP